MTIFYIHYNCNADDSLQIEFLDNSGSVVTSRNMISFDSSHWHTMLESNTNGITHYRYVHFEKSGVKTPEIGELRSFSQRKSTNYQLIHDQWYSKERADSIFLSSAFCDIIYNRQSSKIRPSTSKKNQLSFSLVAANVPHDLSVAVIGNIPQLGNWTEPQLMSCTDFPTWTLNLAIEGSTIDIEYKYVLCDPKSKLIHLWESGANRQIQLNLPSENSCSFHQNDQFFEYESQPYRGSGVAIPVFSLRSHSSFGIGEFLDLLPFIDFASETKMHIVQTLPVNDTIARKTWQDSYPYAAISVFALHPLYVNIPKIADFEDKAISNAYEKDRKELESEAEVDFDRVLERKMFYFRALFEQEKGLLGSDPKFNSFLKENESWIRSYGAFCALRDKYKTADFNQWPKHSTYQKKEIDSSLKEDQKLNEDSLFYQFLQYHADLQLKTARQYGREKRVALKGDLPIGIYRYSCDAWLAPHLYNMNEQAGAPPDAYAVLGQNWGFPTYNWSEMAKDGFSWWRERMQKLSSYFDALRIDHILGFFRIWMIPLHQVQGTLGLFNPRKPYTRDELMHYGLYGDLSHYTQPYIRKKMLLEIFGKNSKEIIKQFLDEHHAKTYQFKAEYQDQKSIERFIDDSNNALFIDNKSAILSLMTEVLLIEEPRSMGTAYNPRITLQTTYLYKSLDQHMKDAFDRMYIDYFYHRHNDFWMDQATWKLPALLNASNMFICGEDLGMIPASVPEVMESLNIIPLEIQRMPKGTSPFGKPDEYPYYSVCSPSCHDMSTIRGWWEENGDRRQRFYRDHMNKPGKAPSKCSTSTVETIVQEHLDSNSMLAIFPIQDILGMDEKLRRDDAKAEQINEPSNPNHYWRYRIHISSEKLLEEQGFMEKWAKMVQKSKRS